MKIMPKDLIKLAAIGAGEMEEHFKTLGYPQIARDYHEKWQMLSHDYRAVLKNIENERGEHSAI